MCGNKKSKETNFASRGRTTTTWWDRLHQNEVIREASSVVSTRWWGGARQGCSGRSPSRSGSSSRSREDPGTGCLSQSPEGEKKKRLLRILRLTSPKPQPTWRNFSILLETKKKRSTRSQYLIMIVLPKKKTLGFEMVHSQKRDLRQAHRARNISAMRHQNQVKFRQKFWRTHVTTTKESLQHRRQIYFRGARALRNLYYKRTKSQTKRPRRRSFRWNCSREEEKIKDAFLRQAHVDRTNKHRQKSKYLNKNIWRFFFLPVRSRSYEAMRCKNKIESEERTRKIFQTNRKLFSGRNQELSNFQTAENKNREKQRWWRQVRAFCARPRGSTVRYATSQRTSACVAAATAAAATTAASTTATVIAAAIAMGWFSLLLR